MIIREALEKDKEQFVSMSKALHNCGASLQSIPREQAARTFGEVMSGNPFALLYVAEDVEQVVGYMLLSHAYSNESGGNIIWIDEIYIKPEFQGKGLGTELLRFVEREYGGKATRIRLEVDYSNEGAKKLYESVGYSKLEYYQMFMDI